MGAMRAGSDLLGLQELQGKEMGQGGEARGAMVTNVEPAVSMGPVNSFQQANVWPQSSVDPQVEPAACAQGCWSGIGVGMGNAAGTSSATLGGYQHVQCYPNQPAEYYSYPTWPMLQPQFLHTAPTVWPTWDPRTAWSSQPLPAISGGPQMATFHNAAPHWANSGHVPPGAMMHDSIEAGRMQQGVYPVSSIEPPCCSNWGEEAVAEVPGGVEREEQNRPIVEEENARLARLRPPDGCPWIEQLRNKTQEDERGKSLERWRQWLLLLRHSAHCPGGCVLEEGCSAAKALRRHILVCENAACAYASCRRTRAVLAHQRSCTSSSCTLCKQVLVAPIPSPELLREYLPNLLSNCSNVQEDACPQPPPSIIPGWNVTPEDMLQGTLEETKQFVKQVSGGGLEDIDMDFCEGSEEGEMVELGGGEAAEGSNISEKLTLRSAAVQGDLDSAFKEKASHNQNVTFTGAHADTRPAPCQNLVSHRTIGFCNCMTASTYVYFQMISSPG